MLIVLQGKNPRFRWQTMPIRLTGIQEAHISAIFRNIRTVDNEAVYTWHILKLWLSPYIVSHNWNCDHHCNDLVTSSHWKWEANTPHTSYHTVRVLRKKGFLLFSRWHWGTYTRGVKTKRALSCYLLCPRLNL